MDINDYQAFLTLAETLHFGRSARQLRMSPSALTRSVQRMEHELGQVLLLRDKRNVNLSRAGLLFAQHARRQLLAHEALVERLAREAEDPGGELRIACTVTACHSVLPRLLADCRDRYPRIQLRLITCDAVSAMSQLQRDEVQVAVVPELERVDDALVFAPLAQTALCFIAPRSDARVCRVGRRGGPGFGQVPLILPARGLERKRLDQFLARRGVQHPNIYAEVSGNEAIIAMVSLGCGVGVVPELVLQGSPLRDKIATVDVKDPPAGFVVGLCAKRRELARRSLGALFALADPEEPWNT